MQALFQSSFLQSLGFAIANSLWQTAILWLLYILLSSALKASATAKYRMAVSMQLASFTWFLFTFRFYYSEYNEALRQSKDIPYAQSIQAVLAGDTGFSSQLIRYMVKAEQALPYISVAYLLLIGVLAIRWLHGFRQTQLVRTTGLQKIPVDWRLFIQRTAPQLGIKKQVALYLSGKTGTPLTIGFWKPIILLPVASINHLTTEQLEAVLLHELAHIKRFDYLVNIVLSVIEIGLFFNPFTQLISKHIRKERENCCDDWVLQFQYKASDYAEALLRIAYLQQAPAFAMAAAGRKNELLGRVKRMIGETESPFNYRRQLLSLVLVTGMLGCIAWLNPSVTNQSATANTSKALQRVAIEPMTVKVSNPLFNPVFFLSEPLKTEMKKSIASASEEIAGVTAATVTNPDLVASIPPLIADALEKASAALGQQEINLPGQLAQMEAARSNMEKILRDSMNIPAPYRSQLTNAFGYSLKDIDKNIASARTDIENAIAAQKNIRIDHEKIKKDIRLAMDEVAKLDLGGLMEESMKMTFRFTEKGPRIQPENRGKIKTPPAPPAPDQPARSATAVDDGDAGNNWTASIKQVMNKDQSVRIINAVQPMFDKQTLDELKTLALLAGSLAMDNKLGAEDEKRIWERMEQLQVSIDKKFGGSKKKSCEEKGTDVEIRMQ